LDVSITSLEAEIIHLLSAPFWAIKSLLAHKNDEGGLIDSVNLIGHYYIT
jgi:hypothetical protein